MSNNPLVSIIIPTYKSNKSLKESIDSVLKQTYENVEVIVVDDNNPNTEYRVRTEIIMEDYMNNPKVVYIQHKKNQNGSAARNTGFKFSKGEYICFLDDDDIFLQTKIEKQIAYLEKNSQFQAVYTWRQHYGEVVKNNKTGDLSEELLSLSFTPYTSSIMLKRECYKNLKGFDEGYRRHQDYEFLLRFFELYSIGVVSEPLVEIKGNNVDNTLHGRDLEQLKEQFLGQFFSHIERINQYKAGFKSLVYSRHYSTVFWDYIKRFKLGAAFRVFLNYSFKYGFTYWNCLGRNLLLYAKIKSRKN